MPEGASSEDVKRAVAIAREALEQDASDARKRGWGTPAPDSTAVASLAAGMLVADALAAAGQSEKNGTAKAARARASRTAA